MHAAMQIWVLARLGRRDEPPLARATNPSTLHCVAGREYPAGDAGEWRWGGALTARCSMGRRSCPPSAGRRTLPEVSRSQTVRRLLVVEARDLDTDERTRREIEVETPNDEAGQRAQLATVVGQLHPDARMRSFGGQTASFLDAVHLVVAHYGPALDEPIRSSDDHLVTEQQPLFAA